MAAGTLLAADASTVGAGARATRVLHVSQPTDAGVARVVLSLVAHGVDTGLAVTLACPTEGPLATRAERAGAVVVPWESVREPARGLAREVAALRDVVRTVAPDVVHLHSSKAGLVGRLALRGRIPTVFQPHAWADQAAHGPVRVAARVWERVADRWADVTVCGSDAEAAHGAGLGVRDAVVVRNGVDPHEFTPRDRAAARARVGLRPDDRVAVCVGRLCEQKGQDLLLDLWRALPDPSGRAVLVLVGGGPAEADLRRRAGDGPVRLVTDCDDPRDWYAAADVVVAPSRWEGAALAPLEAMAMGRAVVGHDVGGLGAVLPTAGPAVALGDVDGLARALRRRLADRAGADAEGAANRAAVEQNFDSRATARGITALAVDLAVARHPRSAGRAGRTPTIHEGPRNR